MGKNVRKIAFAARIDAIAAKRDAMDAKIDSRKARVDVIEARNILREILNAGEPQKETARILAVSKAKKKIPKQKKSVRSRKIKPASIRRQRSKKRNVLERILFGKNIYRN